jgi:hypothetical protein
MAQNRARVAAAIVALIAWTGLGVQLAATTGQTGSAPEALWVILRYFTIIANLVAAGIFSAVALGSHKAASPFAIGGIMSALLLTGIVHFLLLRGLVGHGAHSTLADVLLHKVMPVATALYWLAFAAKGCLRGKDPWLWALLPIGYLGYALLRAALDGKYPYPFIDAAELGWITVARNALAMAAGFLIAGWGLVRLDARLGRGHAAPD